ncbi:MAG: DUF3035 domain-containing protein [Rhodoplanes sp.]
MQRLTWLLMLCCGLTLVTSGCSETREALGLDKRQPDEFAVYTRAPLVLPPDYGLRPPTPGSARAASLVPRDEARYAVTGGGALTTGRGPAADPSSMAAGTSPGAQALLERSGALNVEPDIRDVVNQESSILAATDRSFTERLMFWSTPTEYGTVVDPKEEARRIHENQALGRSVTAGTTPTIERKRKALLDGIFN